jgi:F0F1-type ATP synthase assembly protein I
MTNLDKIHKKTTRIRRKYEEQEQRDPWRSLWSLGWRVALEWGSAVVASYFLGRLIDALFHTGPWGLITCLLLGNITGIVNIYRTYQKFTV